MASFERLKEDGRDPAYGTLSEMVGAAEAQQQEEKYAVNYAFWQRAARLLRIVWDESGRPDGARLGRWLLQRRIQFQRSMHTHNDNDKQD